MSEKTKRHLCVVCDKSFSKSSNLKRHVRMCHAVCENLNEGSLKCKEENCNQSFRFLDEFIKHLKTQHNKEMLKETHLFRSHTDFLKWKNEMEKETTSSYMNRSGTRLLKDGTLRTEYYCHRSGIYKRMGKNMRKMKTQGTQKIGCRCSSYISVTERNGECFVKFYKTHYGHKQELRHLRLTPDEKSTIATKLNESVPFDVILNEVRESASGGLKRINFSTNKDLHNIAAQYGINNSVSKASKESCVEKISELESEVEAQGEDNLNLDPDELCLVIMSETQSEDNKFSVREYKCTCPEALRGNMCTHIDLLIRNTKDEAPANLCEEFSTKCTDSPDELLTKNTNLLQEFSTQDDSPELETETCAETLPADDEVKIVEDIFKSIDAISNLVTCNSTGCAENLLSVRNTIQETALQIETIFSDKRTSCSVESEPKSSEPPNKKMKSDMRFTNMKDIAKLDNRYKFSAFVPLINIATPDVHSYAKK